MQLSDALLAECVGILLDLLKDERLEVRELASVTLGGLLQCEHRLQSYNLLEKFVAWSRTPVPKTAKKGLGHLANARPASPANLLSADAIIAAPVTERRVETPGGWGGPLAVRHAGVLGLAAHIIASPYDVPAWLPEVLLEFGSHVSDPVPIQTTVKRTLSEFKRTHQDTWHNVKSQFTDDQLVVLTDLLISPNYYA
eukprot:Opistho-1_new@86436